MKKNIFIYLLVIVLSSLLLTGCTKKEVEEEEDSESTVTEQEEEIEEETEEKDDDLGYISDTSGYTKSKQVLGQASTFEYTIANIETSKGNGYHEFEFTMTSAQEGATVPLFTVEPIPSKGVFRVSLVNIFKDTTTITHSKGVTINEGAITGLTRIVTDSNTTRAYDIGVLGSNTFKLEMSDSSDGNWVFSVKVAYDTKYSAPKIDFGSTEFSSEAQSIEGVTSKEGSKITDYSFLMSGGVIKFSIEVASGASNPIPSVSAEYDDAGLLVVTFPSLSQDKVSTWGSTIALPAGVTVTVSRVGESSVYSFSGISNKKPFKLSAAQSPNLVLVEIKL